MREQLDKLLTEFLLDHEAKLSNDEVMTLIRFVSTLKSKLKNPDQDCIVFADDAEFSLDGF